MLVTSLEERGLTCTFPAPIEGKVHKGSLSEILVQTVLIHLGPLVLRLISANQG